jgi:hypothetical protein
LGRRRLSLKPRVRRPNHLDLVVSKASVLKCHQVVEAATQPLIVFVGRQQDRHSIVHRPDRFVAVSHRAGIDRAPFVTVAPQSTPAKNGLPFDIKPGAGLGSFFTFGLRECSHWNNAAPFWLARETNPEPFC